MLKFIRRAICRPATMPRNRAAELAQIKATMNHSTFLFRGPFRRHLALSCLGLLVAEAGAAIGVFVINGTNSTEDIPVYVLGHCLLLVLFWWHCHAGAHLADTWAITALNQIDALKRADAEDLHRLLRIDDYRVGTDGALRMAIAEWLNHEDRLAASQPNE